MSRKFSKSWNPNKRHYARKKSYTDRCIDAGLDMLKGADPYLAAVSNGLPTESVSLLDKDEDVKVEYKNFYIWKDPNSYSLEYEGDEHLFNTVEEAKEFIDKVTKEA